MRTLEVLGTGCPACTRLASLAAQAAIELGIAYTLEKVGDIGRIVAYDVPATPALVVDGAVRCAGRVPGLDEIKAMLRT